MCLWKNDEIGVVLERALKFVESQKSNLKTQKGILFLLLAGYLLLRGRKIIQMVRSGVEGVVKLFRRERVLQDVDEVSARRENRLKC